MVAGELFEHVPDLGGVVAEACRVLRTGGLLVADTIADTGLARLVAIRLAELVVPAARGIHDPCLLVDPARLVRLCAQQGVDLAVRGVRPEVTGLLRWLVDRRHVARIVPTWTTAVLYQAHGVKGRSPIDATEAP